MAGDKSKQKEKKNSEKEEFISLEDEGSRIRTNFPIFSSSSKDGLIVMGGGGGTSKTGIPNKIVLAQQEESTITKILDVIETSDSVKCLTFHPKERLVVCGVGNTCQTIPYSDQFKFESGNIKSTQTDFSHEEYNEQKSLSFGNGGTTLCTGGSDGVMRLWDFPSMKQSKSFDLDPSNNNDTVKKAVETIHEVVIDPTSAYIATITDKYCRIFNLKSKQLTGIVAIDNEIYNKRQVVWKGARFTEDGATLILGKIAPGQRSWLTKWKVTEQNDPSFLKSVIAHRQDHFNAFCQSPNGKYLATGTSQGSVAVFDSESLHKIMEVAKVHSFFITHVTFTSDSGSVVSSSADYSCKLTPVVEKKDFGTLIIIFLSLIILMIAIVYGYHNLQ